MAKLSKEQVEQLKKIGQEVMKSPVRIKFYDGYATEDVAPIE